MAYKFQRGEAILSGALVQEGNIEIESGFEFQMHDAVVLDTSRNLTVADMSGSGKLEVGGTVQLDGVADAEAVAADKLYFLDSDGLMKADAIEDVRDNLIFDSVSGDATIAHGGALTIAAGAVENDMLAGSIANAKLVNDSVTVTAGAALSGGGEVDLGASINLDVEVDDSSIEVSGDALQVKALGITNDMLSGSIASSKIAELNAFDTADLAEGSNLYFTEARARASVSVTDAGGDGSLSYDSSTGVITFTGPSAAEVRAHLSTGYMIDVADGQFSIDAAEFSGSWDAVLATKTTDDLDEGSSHLYFEDSRARAAVSVTDAGGDGSLAYDSSTGVFTYTGPSAAEVRAHFSGGEMIDLHGDGEIAINAADFSGSWDAVLATKDTGDLAEGSNLYYTEARWDAKMAAADTGDLAEGSNLYFTDARARAAVSVTDAGGDGSLAYDSSTGVITYTGPSADEVRAHLSVADSNSIDMAFAAGQFSADVLVDDHSIEIDATDGLRVKALGIENSMLSGGIASSKIAELNAFDTADLAEGSNLYFTEARARASLSIVDAGGDGSFAYDDSTGVFTYTGPSAAEVRAHLSVADTNSIDMSVTDGQFSADLLLSGSSLEVTADGLRLAAAAAGEGLAWNDGVLSVQGSSVALVSNSSTLAEGYNYFGSNVPAETDWSVTLPSNPAVGDIVHVKAQDIGDLAGITISRAGSQLIDGETSIVLESPYAAVSLVYVASNDWRIV
jgi:hypothetical protein